MGADGHISIYDRSKLVEKYDEEILDSFEGHFLGSKFYRQTLDSKEYLTRYSGDNYQLDDMYDVVQCSYDAETDVFNTKSYSYSAYEAEYFFKLDREIRKTFAEIILFMENEAKVTEWEVWT